MQGVPQRLVHLSHIGRVGAEGIVPPNRKRGKVRAVRDHQRENDYESTTFYQQALE